MAPPCSVAMEVVFLPFSTLLSCLLAFANASRTSCARSLALTRPTMAAGRWPSRAAAKSRRRRVPFASAELGQSGRGPKPLPGRRAPLSLGPRGPKVAMGQLISSGVAQYRLNALFFIYSLLFEI